MSASVPTTRPSSTGGVWRSWSDLNGLPPWRYERVAVWKRGWLEARIIDPGRIGDNATPGLQWRPHGPLLTMRDTVMRMGKTWR